MKGIRLMGAALVVFAVVISTSGVLGQFPQKKFGPFKGKGFGGGGFGGGFERPLAAEPRRGNPGASPDLSAADFRDIVAHAKDFDANKDGRLSKAEVPELFATFFDRADTDGDGVLDHDEIRRVLAPSPAAVPTKRTQIIDPRPVP